MCPDLFFGHKDSNKYTQRSANVVEQDRSVQKEDKATILTVLAKVDVGEPIDVQIFFNGLRAVKALALSSKKIWQHIATSTVRCHPFSVGVLSLTYHIPSERLELSRANSGRDRIRPSLRCREP